MIAQIVERLQKAVLERLPEDQFEIILVDDSSPDNTAAVIAKLADSNANVRALSLSKNFGQQSAIMAGFSVVEGNVVICLDDDGQTPPEDVFLLLDKLNEGYDLVYASYKDKRHSAFRNFGSWVNEKMAEMLLGKPKEITLSSFYAARRFLVNEALKCENPFPYINGQFLRATSKIANVPISHQDRIQGSSGYTIRKLLALWVNGFTAFSVRPLRVASFFGIFLSFIGLLSFLTIVFRKLLNPDIAIGWTSTIALMLLIGGTILFVLGFIGEYIGRIYMSVNKLPQFVIRNATNCPNLKDLEVK